MTVEELKKEADKLGYRVLKKEKSIPLSACPCGRKKPWEGWHFGGGYSYKCPNCGNEAPVASTKKQARINWNEFVLTTQN